MEENIPNAQLDILQDDCPTFQVICVKTSEEDEKKVCFFDTRTENS